MNRSQLSRIRCNPFVFVLHTFMLLCVLHAAEARRGPHHPASEVRRATKAINHHLTHDNDHMQQEIADSPLASHSSKPVEDMSDEEKAFYYFKLHDLDNNDALDGLELLQAALHHHEHHEDNQVEAGVEPHGSDVNNNNVEGPDDDHNVEHIIGVIDDFISHADSDANGMLNFAEYTSATRPPVEVSLDAAAAAQLPEEDDNDL